MKNRQIGNTTHDDDTQNIKHNTENQKDGQYGANRKWGLTPGARKGQASHKTPAVLLT